MRSSLHAVIVVCLVAGSSSCDRDAPKAPQPPAPAATARQKTNAPVQPVELWRRPGHLLGATASHAVLLGDQLEAVELRTGTVAGASTTGEDPVPSFKGYRGRNR